MIAAGILDKQDVELFKGEIVEISGRTPALFQQRSRGISESIVGR
jgi:hypothetical protein